jgi:glycosyltransferase involved in cell wall biosynthesis
MDPEKHILFISSWYPHRNNLTHGIFNRYFAQAVSLYNKVSVLHVCSDKTLEQEMEFVTSNDGGVQTLHVYYKPVSFLRPFKKYRTILRAYREGYKRLFPATKPQLIQLNVIMPAAAGVLYLSRKYDIPFVINENWSGYTEEDGNYSGPLKKYFTRRAVRRAKVIMPTSRYLMEAMQAHSLKGEYFIVPNVVNVNVFTPRKVPAAAGTTFIHISSLNDREKNVSGIIMAFAEAAATVPGLKLNIVGEGIDRPVYEKMVENLGMTGRIVFLGRLMAQDLVNEINAAHALVMYSNYETFCLVIVEAFACGKPVITSNAGAIAGYMKPSLGIMVEKGRYEGLRDAMVTFANNMDQFDPQFIRDFAVNNYSYEIVGKKLSSIYDFALGGPKPME